MGNNTDYWTDFDFSDSCLCHSSVARDKRPRILPELRVDHLAPNGLPQSFLSFPLMSHGRRMSQRGSPQALTYLFPEQESVFPGLLLIAVDQVQLLTSLHSLLGRFRTDEDRVAPPEPPSPGFPVAASSATGYWASAVRSIRSRYPHPGEWPAVIRFTCIPGRLSFVQSRVRR